MKPSIVGSFLARLRQWYFEWRTNREIFERMFPHLNGEADSGYSFTTCDQMEDQTEALDTSALMEKIEGQIARMPDSYGKCFRHLLHRELQATLRKYEREARRRVQPVHVDPRLVATRA